MRLNEFADQRSYTLPRRWQPFSNCWKVFGTTMTWMMTALHLPAAEAAGGRGSTVTDVW